MGLIDKVKEKLHIGDEGKTSGSTGSHTHSAHSPAAGTGTTGSHSTTASGLSGQGASGNVAQGATHSSGATGTQGTGSTGAHGTGSTNVVHGSGAHGTGASNVAQAAGASGATHATGATGAAHSAAGQTSHTGSHTGAKTATQDAVTIHERDPNWQKARELTTGAEHQSKLSAAKAYEAEAFLVGASESHEQAQAALSAKTNLLAQAEAEKRNIGQADYIHKEYDHAKKVQEDLEKHRIEINKGVDQTKGLVAAKEKELQAVLPQAQQQASQIDALTGKLGSLQQAKAGLENKEAANAQRLRELEGQKGQFAGQIESLEADVLRLNKHADDLERQAHAARQEANTAGARLKELRGSLSTIARDQDAAARSLQAVNKDLEAYKMKEAELAEKLNAAQLAAKRSADAAAAKEAELQLARQQFEAERAKGQPIEKEIEKYRLQIQEKERQYTEAQESSKTAKAAYEKFLGEANAADAAYKKALSEKERKVATYSQTKQEAELANARATDMWNQAKKFGNTGDANALQRLAEAEKTLQQEEGLVSRELVAPNVGVKQPTSEGPKFTRTEDSRERNEDTQKETVRTKALA